VKLTSQQADSCYLTSIVDAKSALDEISTVSRQATIKIIKFTGFP